MSNSILQTNLEALSSRCPDTARRVADCPIQDPKRIQLVGSREQAPGLLVCNPAGRRIPLHNPQQPLSEAVLWVKSLPKEVLRGANVLILGIGLAYHIRQFLKESSPEARIVLVEPDREVLRFVLENVDLSSVMSAENTLWLAGLSPQQVVQRLQSGQEGHRFAGQGLQLLSLAGFRTYYEEYFASLVEEIQAGLVEAQVRHRTIRLQARDILCNILENLPHVLDAPGVSSLRSLGAGLPAFVVAPGPSLERNLDLLRQANRKGYVIAVDTAARILRREQVPYHCVVTVDHTELNRDHFDNADDDQASLVAYPGVNASIPALYRDRCYFYDHLGDIEKDVRASVLLETLGVSDRLGSLISLGSTTDTAYHLARHMACSPIVFVGVDLAFPGDRFYAKGAMQEEKRVDSPHTSRQYTVTDNRGNEVTTSHIYRLFGRQLGDLIRSTGGLVYNTSLEGAQIAHTTVLDLETVLGKLPNRELPVLPSSGRQINRDVAGKLESILTMMKEERRLVRPWEKEIRRLDVRNDQKFRQRMLPVLKEIAVGLNERESLQLAASLAEGSASQILGQVDGVGLLGGGLDANDVARERVLKWVREVREGIDFAVPVIEKAIRSLG